jgi:hypothetical protein
MRATSALLYFRSMGKYTLNPWFFYAQIESKVFIKNFLPINRTRLFGVGGKSTEKHQEMQKSGSSPLGKYQLKI